MYRLQLLGFNAVRLPFSFSDLYDKQPQSQQRNCAQASLRLSLRPLYTLRSTFCLSALHCRICLIGMRSCSRHLKVMP